MEGSLWPYGHAPLNNGMYLGGIRKETSGACDLSHGSHHQWNREDGASIAEPVVEIKTAGDCLEVPGGGAQEPSNPSGRPFYSYSSTGMSSNYARQPANTPLLYNAGRVTDDEGSMQYQTGNLPGTNQPLDLPKREVDEEMMFSHSILEPENDHPSALSVPGLAASMKENYNASRIVNTLPSTPRGQTQEYYHGRSKSACAFCGEMFTHVIAHMMTAHSDVPQVAEAMLHEKGSAKRRALFIALKNKGSYLYKHYTQNEGEVNFSPESDSMSENSLQKIACKYCSRHYKPHKIRYHYMKCAAYKESTNHNTFTFRREMRKQDHYKKCMNIMQSFPFVHERVASEILARMRQDKITTLILNDPLLLKYAEVHIQGDTMPSFVHKIKQDLRNLGKLILNLREKDETIQCMTDVLKPSSFGLVVRCVQECSGFNSLTCSYERISTPMNIGYVLRKSVELLRDDALKNMDESLVQQCNEFSELMINDWKDCLSLDNIRNKKRERLPLQKDIQILQYYFDREIALVMKKLNETKAASQWRRLSRLALASIVLFNRGSSRKIDRMTMEDFENGCSSETILPELEDKLSHLEKQSICNLTRIIIHENPSKKVPILLKPMHMEAVKMLNGLRNSVGVVDNPYVFARPGGETPLRGDVIREFAHRAGLEQPNNITPSNLRKHVIASNSMSDLSKLSNTNNSGNQMNEQGDLANQYSQDHDGDLYRTKAVYNQYDDTMMKNDNQTAVDVNLSQLNGDCVMPPGDDSEDDTKKEFNLRDNGSRYWFLDYSSSDLDLESGDDSDYEPASRRGKSRGLKSRKMGPRKRMAVERVRHSEIPPSTVPSEVKVRHYVRGKTRKQYTYCRWSGEEESVVFQTMAHHFKCGTLPGKQECLRVIGDNSILQKRKWEDLKNYVRNKLVSLAKTNTALQNSVREFCSITTALGPHSSS
ncbi:hypothetical protein SK128_016955 [Halocaridina rubra]|uniref:Uncharacterized protein n=1 Tax=Halocaridina rubra TaxID=373956 RepID=A0AAN8XMR7_HALRR